jgi:hypothetical protein
MTLQDKGKRNEALDVPASSVQSSTNHTARSEEIRLRAYEIYLQRGGLPGNELDDWLQAEGELERAAPPNAKGFSV